jgi:hypothetical protein
MLFNDHTVYARPDFLHHRRVLAAIVRGKDVFVPLRAMFEQMGGVSVTVSPDSKTVAVAKGGASASVTLGSRTVLINGEPRTLDVPPMLVHGILFVPVRVLSEAMGAYVEWVPDRGIVVVRYILPTPEATPTPTPVPTPTPTAMPTLGPTPKPTPKSYQFFAQGGFVRGNNYNEFVAGKCCCPDSWTLSGAYVFPSSPLAVKFDVRKSSYVTSASYADALGNPYTQFATLDGGVASVPEFAASQSTFDMRLEYKLFDPHVYAGVGYLMASNSYGYPRLTGLGFGVEKLPDFRAPWSFYGSAFYYPSASGTFAINGVGAQKLQYAITKFDLGVAWSPGHSPVYAFAGFNGDQYLARQNAPIGQTHSGPYFGLGFKL